MSGEVDPRNRHIRYGCTACGVEYTRDDLTAKRVVFADLGTNNRIERSRTIAWLCESCKLADTDWNRERTKGAPGMENTKLNPV